MERLAKALSIIQQGMLRNNPRHVTDSVNEATEVLDRMCSTPMGSSLKAGWKSKRDWNPIPPRKRWRPSGDHLWRLWEIFQKSRLRVKKGSPLPPQKKTAKRGKGGRSPSYTQVAKSRLRLKKGTGKWSRGRVKKKKKRRR